MKNELPYCKTSDSIVGYEHSELAKLETKDCVVKSFASAFEITYELAHQFVKETFNRENKRGTTKFATTMNLMASLSKLLNNRYLKCLGEKTTGQFYSLMYDVKVKGITRKRKMTVGRFSKQYQKGTYILMVKGHAFTIKDGIVNGNESDAKKLKRTVYQAWEVVKS